MHLQQSCESDWLTLEENLENASKAEAPSSQRKQTSFRVWCQAAASGGWETRTRSPAKGHRGTHMAVHLEETKPAVACTAGVHTPSVNQVQKPQVKATRPVLAIIIACLRAFWPSLKKLRIMVPTAVPVGYGSW